MGDPGVTMPEASVAQVRDRAVEDQVPTGYIWTVTRSEVL